MQFTNTVSSVCGEFTKKLEKIQKAKLVEVGKINTGIINMEKKLEVAEAKADEVFTEIGKADKAIRNIKKLFGEV